MMWNKSNSNVNKLMTDIAMKKISVSRLICVKAIAWVKGMICAILLAGTMLTACGVQDKALVLVGEEAANIQTDGENGAAGLIAGEEALTEQARENVRTIVVFVCGAVCNPGVVELPEGSRAADALEAVGGLLAEAQPDYVNLAEKLEDAQKLYFPTVEEAGLLAQEQREAASGLVNINTADKERLCTLPGIGETRAEAIIAYREKNGGFRSKEDIMQVSGIKQSAYDKLRDYIIIE